MLSCSLGHSSDGTSFSARIQRPRFILEACGNPGSLAEIGEQLAWLASALQPSPGGNGPFSCTPFISDILKSIFPSRPSESPVSARLTYKIGFSIDAVQKSVDTASCQCWHDMFLNPMIVKGYPIPSRVESNTGMEIPLNVMAGLARSEQVDRFNGKTFIKGFSTLLVPAKRIGDMLLWHLLYKKDGSRISYLDSTATHAEDVSSLDLGSLQHVLGWCSEAQFYSGKSRPDCRSIVANVWRRFCAGKPSCWRFGTAQASRKLFSYQPSCVSRERHNGWRCVCFGP